MTTTCTRPPAGLEHKSAPAMLAPRPSRPVSSRAALSGVTEVDGAGELVALVAVTGVEDDVHDVIEPGAFRASLRERKVRGVLGHDWNRPVAQAVEVDELMPGDPRLPRTAPDGTRWPPEAGALRVKARYLLGTKDGREAYEVARAFGPEQGFSIGYRVKRARRVGAVRHIDDLDLFEFSPVLHGCNRLARLVSVKGSQPALETKATSGVITPARRRAGAAAACSVCGRPAAVRSGGLRRDERLICRHCVDEAAESATIDTATIDADDLAAAYQLTDVELTSEEEYAEALDAEIRWNLEPDGTLALATDDPTRRRVWGRDQGRAWGRP